MIPLIASREGVAVAQTWHELPSPLGVPAFVLNTLIPGPYVIVRPDFRAKLYPALRPLIDRKPGGFIASGSSIPRSTLSEVERVALRKRMSKGKERLIVFFGFLYPFKRVELLFEIADPMRDHLVIAGEQSVDPEYSRSIQSRAETAEWRNSVTMTGFLSETETADLLAAADAVVLPFQHGGGIWNSSIHAALLQGTFVLTTSTTTTGFDEAKNTYFSEVDDMAQMRSALDQYWSQRRAFDPALDGDEWRRIAGEHLKFYRAATLARQSSGRPH